VDPQVDSVAQRARHPAGVSIDDCGLAAAPPVALADVAARARVHGRHELKPRREDRRPTHARNCYLAILERLAECL